MAMTGMLYQDVCVSMKKNFGEREANKFLSYDISLVIANSLAE